MNFEGTYNLLTARVLAKDIVDKITPEIFYSTENLMYRTAPPCKLLRRVDGFEEYVLKCFDNSDERIEIHNLRYDMGAGIYGMYIRQSHFHYVLINSKINLCWNRFARLKELCSIYVDHYYNSNNSTDYLSAIENAFSQKEFLNNIKGVDPGDLDSESFAILLATELMIPIYERETINNYFEKINRRELTYNDLAKSLLMPEHVLKLYHTSGLINIPPLYSQFG